jgi:hypothetical protein
MPRGKKNQINTTPEVVPELAAVEAAVTFLLETGEELVDKEVSEPKTRSGNSGKLAAIKARRETVATDLTAIMRKQIETGKIQPILTESLCKALDLQVGAMKNAIRGFFWNGSEAHFLYGDEAVRAVEQVDAHVKEMGEKPRIIGGLALFSKGLPEKYKGQTKVRGEKTPKYHYLGLSVYWKSGNPKVRSD